MPDIFLSYAREDVAIAKQLSEYFQKEGWSVFWDREIPVGKPWENVIEEQISRATCVVVLWSLASVSSDWVRAEAGAAADRNVLVPALLDGASLPMRFRIIQTADLKGWHGSREHVGLTSLIAAVRAALGPTGKHNSAEPVFDLGESRRPTARRIAIAEIETGENRGRSLALTEGMTSITLGRGRDCDFVIDDYYISRSHCRIQIQPIHSGSVDRNLYSFLLIDFGSPAGTIVNDKRVDRVVELRDGDRFQIGNVRFRFRIMDENTA